MMSSNGVFFIVSLGHALWVYCAIGSQLLQSVCAPFVYIRKNCSTHWFVRSDCPSVCGWYALLMFCWICNIRHSSLVNLAVKCVLCWRSPFEVCRSVEKPFGHRGLLLPPYRSVLY